MPLERLQNTETRLRKNSEVAKLYEDTTDKYVEKGYEPHRDKSNKMACAPSEDSDQPWHPPSLIRVFVVRLKESLGP